MMNRVRLNTRKGFSIIEVIIALTVISVAFVAVATLVGKNLQANARNQHYLTAHFLTQESLEVVRNLRDKAWLNNFTLDGKDVDKVLSEALPSSYGQDTEYYKLIDDRNSEGGIESWRLRHTSPNFDSNALNKNTLFNGRVVYSDSVGAESVPANFARYVAITPLNSQSYGLTDELVLEVEAVTMFGDGEGHTEVRYSTILTDWKQGAL